MVRWRQVVNSALNEGRKARLCFIGQLQLVGLEPTAPLMKPAAARGRSFIEVKAVYVLQGVIEIE
jgi:hypothetical protein